MNRQEIDLLGRTLLSDYKNVLLEWATGCGKTKQAITGISMLDRDEFNRVLIVVAEVAHKKNWIDEFHKWGFSSLLTDVNFEIEIICYDSLHHHQDEHYNLVIFDEAHHIFTEIRTSILRRIHSDRFILLSATMDDNIINEIEDIIGYVMVSRISLQTAIDWGLVPAPRIILYPLTLDNTILNHVITEERGSAEKAVTINCNIKDKWIYLRNKKKYPNIKLVMPATSLQYYNQLDSKIEFYKKLFFAKQSESIKSKWLHYGLQRKTFLGLLKDDAAKKIIQEFGKCRFICFCTNVEQADKLGGSHSINYKNKESLDVIDRFNNKEINSLFVVGMLQEGQNLNDIEKGIIIQLDGKLRSFIQKSGRVLRAEHPEIFIIYVKGTRDEEYLKNALEGLNPDYITYYEDYNQRRGM